jgi:4-amino-4-deoxy-L-arabinose transferase-like glycosyltransferase
MDGFRKKELIFLIFIFLFAFILRISYCFFFKENILHIQTQIFGDTQDYIQIAQNFLSGKGLISSPERIAYRPPLYPLFLSGVYYLFGDGYWPIRIIQSILDALTCMMVYFLGRMILNKRTGEIASFICAIYPFFIFFTGFELTETLFIFLLLLVILYLQKIMTDCSFNSSISCGVFIGLSALCKPTMLGFIPIALTGAALLLLKRRNCWKYFWAMTITTFIILSPWIIRNYIHFHKFVPGTTMGGLVLFAGNNPLNKSGGGIEGIDYVIPSESKHLGELEQDIYLRTQALNYIKNYPGNFLKLSFVKFIRFWRLDPYAKDFSRYKLLSIFFDGLLLSFFIAGMICCIRKRRECLFVCLIIIYFTVFHMITIGSIRYRIPIMPYVIVFGSYSLSHLFYNFSKRK